MKRDNNYYIGEKDSKILIIGDMPDARDRLSARPFSGRAGSLLFQSLSRAGINGSTCLFTYVITSSIHSSISYYITKKQKGVVEKADYAEQEEAFLSFINSLSPNVIVAIGNVPLYALTGEWGVEKFRGSILLSTKLAKQIKVIPTLSMRECLIDRLKINLVVLDLKRVKKESQIPDYTASKPEIKILDTFSVIKEEMKRWIERADRAGKSLRIGFDTEIVGNELYCMAFSFGKEETYTVALSNKFGNLHTPEQELTIMRLTKQFLEHENIVTVAHNTIFDYHQMAIRYGIIFNSYLDSMIAHAICYPDFRKSLALCTSIYTDIPYYKDSGKIWNKVDYSDVDFYIYNGLDALACLLIYNRVEKDAIEQRNLDILLTQTAIISPLTEATILGILFDSHTCSMLKKITQHKINTLYKEFTEKAGEAINIASPKQIASLLYIKHNYPPQFTKAKTITTNEKALKKLARVHNCELARDIITIRGYKTLISRYLDVKLAERNRLTTSYNPVGTKNGRISSSKNIFGIGANMQNQPASTKNLLLADPGTFFVIIDIEQAENRIVAYIAPEPRMIEAFETGIDVHAKTASLIYNISIEDVSREPGSSGISEHLSQRDVGKSANHQLNYGEGPYTFSAILDIPNRHGKEIREKYYRIYPGIRRYHNWIEHQLKTKRFLVNCLGRRKYFMSDFGTNILKSGYNYIPQSTVADVMNRAIVSIYNLNICNIINQEHDSLWLRLFSSDSLEKLTEKITILKQHVETTLTWEDRTFTLPVSVKIGYSIGHAVKLTNISPLSIQSALAESKKNRNNYVSQILKEYNNLGD